MVSNQTIQSIKHFKSCNPILIDSIIDCTSIVEKILMHETIIAVDCEGIFLSKDGRLTLIQVN